jgi:hypothetical protein
MCPGEALREWTPVHLLCIVREMWPGFLDQIRCPRNAMNLSVATRKCCDHFFVALIAPVVRRMSILFLKSPRKQIVDDYAEFHPVRVMTRIVLRAGELGPEQLAVIQALAQSSTVTQHIGHTRPRDVQGFGETFGELHGTFRLQLAMRLIQSLHCCTTGERLSLSHGLPRGRFGPCGTPIITSWIVHFRH